MKSSCDQLARALAAPTRGEALAALGPIRPEWSLPEVNQLARRLEELGGPRQPVRVGLVRTYTTELLRPYWTLEGWLRGLALEIHECPYGSLFEEARPEGALRAHQPEIIYFFLQWEDLDPRFLQPITAVRAGDQESLQQAAVEKLADLLRCFRAAGPALLVASFLPRPFPSELGLCDPMVAHSEAVFFAALKGRIAAHLRAALPHALFCDLDEVLKEVGRRRFFDFRLWFSSRAPFSGVGAQAVVSRLATYASLLTQPRVKCLVLDADHTLWGGIVGEDGAEGIALGPEYPGAAYVAFQRRLLHFQQRGLLLALCSKNNLEDVQEILRDHPHQVLREAHFAALRVNWEPKADNVRALATELNLGLESFLFVDDSPQELLALRQAIPEMTVVQVPARAEEIPFCLDALPQLETLTLTEEDRQRTAFYAAEQARQHQAGRSRTPEEYLVSLRMVMTVAINDRAQVPRLAQLTQKTNQFNLTTRRYSEAEMGQFMDEARSLVASFALTDLFGASGVVGLAIIRSLDQAVAEVDTFLMSCRVIGRRAETAFLREVLAILAERGVARLRARYSPTRKNGLVRDFWPRHGFRAIAPDEYEQDLGEHHAVEPPPIRVQRQPGAAGAGC